MLKDHVADLETQDLLRPGPRIPILHLACRPFHGAAASFEVGEEVLGLSGRRIVEVEDERCTMTAAVTVISEVGPKRRVGRESEKNVTAATGIHRQKQTSGAILGMIVTGWNET